MIEKIYLIQVLFAYFQIFFLPGIIISYYLNYNSNLFSLFTITFVSSFIVNYLLLIISIIFNFYSYLFFYFIFIVEISICIFFYSEIKTYLLKSYNITQKELKIYIQNNKTIINTFSLVLIGVLFFTLKNILIKNNSIIDVFVHGDAIEYYSIWAKDYFFGTIPKTSFLRPQIWSANISLVYIFLNNSDLEMFTKIIFNLIPMIMLIALVGFTLKNNNSVLFFTGLIGIIFSLNFTFGQATSGYMEIPLGLAFFIFFFFLKDLLDNKYSAQHEIFILTSITSLTILTKELGFLVSLPYLLYFYFNRKNINIKKNFVISSLLISSIVLPFYIFQIVEYDIFNNNELFKLIFFDKEFHETAGHNENFINLKTRILYALNYLPIYILIPFLILTFTNLKSRFHILLKIFNSIYIISWILIFSNEIRYLFPLIFILSMFGYEPLIYNFKNNKFSFLNIKYLIILCSIVFLFLTYISPDKTTLVKKNINKKINEYEEMYNFDYEMYKYIQDVYNIEDNKSKKLVTNFQLIRLASFSTDIQLISNTSFMNIVSEQDFEKKKLYKFDFIVLHKNCEIFKKFKIKFKLNLLKETAKGSCFFEIL